jgi:hypothetical protein
LRISSSGDRDHRHHGFEPLAVLRERAEHGLGDDPGQSRGHEGAATPMSNGRRYLRLTPTMLAIQGGEDQHRLEPFAEDDDRAVRDDGRRRVGASPPPLGCVDELGVESDERRVELRARVLPLHELDKAGVVAVAVPEQCLRCAGRATGRSAQPLLGPTPKMP